MKKTMTVLMVLACMVLSGCQSQKTSHLSSDNPVTITIWHYYNGAQMEAFDQLVDTFNQTIGKEKGIIVQASGQGNVTELQENVISSINGNARSAQMPDIFQAYVDTAYQVDQKGYAVDLTQYFSDEEIAAYIDGYIAEGYDVDGEGLKILPIAKSCEVFMLNKTDWDKFAAATQTSKSELETYEGVTRVAKAYYEWTDSLTPQANDGKAFFGRDALANFFYIASKEFGEDIVEVDGDKYTLHFEKEFARKIWDNYYVPYIHGYFTSSGRFRSDDIKTGNIISFIGSSSGATFFPNQVILNDQESYSIETEVFACPHFEDGENYAVQQGAGMVVTKSDEAKQEASAEFLKWFTQSEQNIEFSISSGYLPVLKEANSIEAIEGKVEAESLLEDIVTVGVTTTQNNEMYTPRVFPGATETRSLLGSSLDELAKADRLIVEERLAAGQSLQEACLDKMSDDYFDQWYQSMYQQLQSILAK